MNALPDVASCALMRMPSPPPIAKKSANSRAVMSKSQPNNGLAGKKISVNFTSLNVLYSTEKVQAEKARKILKLARGNTITVRSTAISRGKNQLQRPKGPAKRMAGLVENHF